MALPDGSFVSFRMKDFRWKSTPELKPLIESDARFTAPEGAELVKSGPARRVWRFRAGLGGSAVSLYVKECLLPEWRDRLKYLFRPAKAASEFEALCLAKERGVNAPEPLAVGVSRLGMVLKRSILVTRALPDAVPIDGYVLERLEGISHTEVVEFTRRFAAFVRKIHDAGFFHRDFHGANLLVNGARGAPGEAEFYLVDLDDVTVGEELCYGKRLENLAILGRFFCQVVPRHWRLRFLKAYAKDAPTVALAAQTVEQMAVSGMRAVWAKKDRRICGDNKYFRHVTLGRLAGHMRRTAEAKAAVALFAEGDPFPRAEALLKDGRSSTIGVFGLGDEAGGKRVVIKRRNPRRSWKRFLDPVRMSRAMRGFFAGAAFENRCLPTPRILATLDCRRFGRLGGDYLVLEYVEGAENLAKVIAMGPASPLFQRINADRAGFLKNLARIVRRMHFCGFSMRDLKAANVLVYLDDGRVAVMLSDLEDIGLYARGVPERRAIQNIARLYADAVFLDAVSRREAVEFLGDYLGPCDRGRFLRWMSGIREYAGAKCRSLKRTGI